MKLKRRIEFLTHILGLKVKTVIAICWTHTPEKKNSILEKKPQRQHKTRRFISSSRQNHREIGRCWKFYQIYLLYIVYVSVHIAAANVWNCSATDISVQQQISALFCIRSKLKRRKKNLHNSNRKKKKKRRRWWKKTTYK